MRAPSVLNVAVYEARVPAPDKDNGRVNGLELLGAGRLGEKLDVVLTRLQYENKLVGRRTGSGRRGGTYTAEEVSDEDDEHAAGGTGPSVEALERMRLFFVVVDNEVLDGFEVLG